MFAGTRKGAVECRPAAGRITRAGHNRVMTIQVNCVYHMTTGVVKSVPLLKTFRKEKKMKYHGMHIEDNTKGHGWNGGLVNPYRLFGGNLMAGRGPNY
jgi:hypothetical protein